MALVNTFNVGHDISVDSVDPVTGKMISWPPPTGFSRSPAQKMLMSEPITQPPIHRIVEGGWHGTMDFDRSDNSVDSFFARNETLYWQGVDIVGGTITETIKEKDGSVSQYQYTNVTFQYSNAGHWRAQDKVPIQVSWSASQRLQVV